VILNDLLVHVEKMEEFIKELETVQDKLASTSEQPEIMLCEYGKVNTNTDITSIGIVIMHI